MAARRAEPIVYEQLNGDYDVVSVTRDNFRGQPEESS